MKNLIMQIVTSSGTKYTGNFERARQYLVLWVYASIFAHFIVGLLMPWIADLSLFSGYHQTLEAAFWSQAAPAAARAQQAWWISLFGPTVQSVAIWMGALAHIGNRQRSSFAWAWLIIGLLVWAPQDMLVSLRASARIHVWIDSLALLAMLPPLCCLWWYDKQSSASGTATAGIAVKL
jgi:hypothetical protein